MKNKDIRFRVNEEEKKKIVMKSKENGFDTVSDYCRYLALNSDVKIEFIEKKDE
jgi:hypothetical protein